MGCGRWQVEHALRRQSGTPQLPEVWELLYKVARDMSRAAGAEELVNSLQTAAESYLVVSQLHEILKDYPCPCKANVFKGPKHLMVSLPCSISCYPGFPTKGSASMAPRCPSQRSGYDPTASLF